MSVDHVLLCGDRYPGWPRREKFDYNHVEGIVNSNPTLLQYHFKEASTFSTRTPQSSKNVIYGWGVDVDRRKEEPIHTQYRMTGETTHVNHKRR